MTSASQPPQVENGQLVSVVIPTHNRGRLLQQAIESLRKQTHSAWEAIVIDDHSSEDIAGSVGRISTQDPRVRVITQEPGRRGAPAARNRGLELSRGDYLVFLDSDDLLSETCLENRLASFALEPAVDFVVGATAVFHERLGDSGKVWNVLGGDDDLDRFLRADTPWQTAGPLWRREALERVGRWDEGACDWQDWEFHTRALALGLSYRKLEVVDTYWRSPRQDSLSVARAEIDPDRQISRVKLCVRIRECLQANNALTTSRERALSTLSAHFIREALWQRKVDLASELGKICLSGRLVTGLRRGMASMLEKVLRSRLGLFRRPALRAWCKLMIRDRLVLNSTTRWSEVGAVG